MQMLAEPSDLSAGRAIEVHFIGIKIAAIDVTRCFGISACS